MFKIINMLDNCINAALYKIFKVDCASVAYLRKFLNIRSVAISAERRRLGFMNKCLSLIDFKQVMSVYHHRFISGNTAHSKHK